METDWRNEKVGYKIRQAQMEKVPYMIVIGAREEENQTVSVRSRKEGDLGSMPIDDFIRKITDDILTKAK